MGDKFTYGVYVESELIEEFDTFKRAKEEAEKHANQGFKEKFYILKYRKVFEIEG